MWSSGQTSLSVESEAEPETCSLSVEGGERINALQVAALPPDRSELFFEHAVFVDEGLDPRPLGLPALLHAQKSESCQREDTARNLCADEETYEISVDGAARMRQYLGRSGE